MSGTGEGDRTAARILDAAVDRFGRDGFGVGIRAIAADAGVSPALVIHYFGGKDRLRAACDAHVLAALAAEKHRSATDGTAAGLIARLAEIEGFAPMTAYILRSLREGGDLARAFMEQLIADSTAYLEAGVAAGVIRPSRDPVARSRMLSYQAAGSMVLWLTLHPEYAEPDAFARGLNAFVTETMVPMLEVYAEGLYTNPALLEEYLSQLPDTSSSSSSSSEAES
ncbi:TetR family transcriptional regulator [Actinocorallia sp. API 0066]|uniref:TetR/AcrR family transcriptional regulator n=1 Tax=Actinocorallia sp. API 0066 TaxID=2896846 RepID=UPI001E44C0BA|nr:TetR family transcriptional regulator [Actinocorallia sp. API 0066]MCD0448523.1 TetR family transcriptional regulator [Actinocorallia sp. API 0066]